MNRPKWLTLTTSLAIILTACSTDSTQDLTQTNTSTKSGTAEFSRGLSVRELSGFLRTSKLAVEYALFTQTVAGEETVGGVLLEGRDLGKLEDKLRESTEGFVADMALTDKKGGKFKALAKQVKSAVDAPRITGITGEFSHADVTKLKGDPRVSKLLFEPENPQTTSPTVDIELETQGSRGPG